MNEPLARRRWPKVLAGVAVLLAALVAVGVFALDRILLSQAHEQTDALSRQLGRTVSVEGIRTKLLGGLGVRVTGVAIGPGPGEEAPLLELQSAEVGVHLLRAIFSGGKDIEVREAVIAGLRVNVIRFPDGTTNVERLSKAMEQKAQAKPEKAVEEKKPTDLSAIRVDRAAVENARIAFLDKSTPGAKELYVDHLDVELKDLRAGQPLEVVLHAAVLAQRQNLELRLKAAPLPASLVPTPDEVVLKVEPIDLAPLAPFLPASVGLRGGQFQADLQAALGAAVPGGKGKTHLQGGFRATQLEFAGQAGGKKLDASLAADLDGDVAAGDLRIGKLDLDVGPAGLTGHGRASGLTGGAPRVEGLEIVGRNLDPALVAEYYPPLRKQLGGAVIAGPVGLSLKGSGTGSAQALELRVDLGPVRLEVPHQLAKAAGAPMALVARADAAQGGGQVRFDAALDLAGADLRPGGTLAKKPGDPLSVKLAGAYRKAAAEKQVELTSVQLVALGDTLAGKGKVVLGGTEKKPTTRFEADLAGDHLDLDRLLLPSPAEKTEKGGKPPEAAKQKTDPAAFAGLSGVASLRLGLLRMKGVDARDVAVRLRVEEDLVTLEEARLQAFGGKVDASGSALRLAHPDEPFKAVAKLDGVEGEQVLGLFSKRKVLGGKLDTNVDLSGKGTEKDVLEKTLTGTIGGKLHDGVFYGKDLLAGVLQPISKKLPISTGKVTEGGSTPLGKELPFAFTVANGEARLQKPIPLNLGEDAIALEGGVRLDGTLQMPATVKLSPATVAKLTGGKAKPKEAIPVTCRLAGPAWNPSIEGLSVDSAASAIAQEAVSGALGHFLGGNTSSGSSEAEKKAGAASQDEADKARKDLEAQAKKKLQGLFGK
jgi:AsmA protein